VTRTAQKISSYRGPAILSYGFRPFFLFAAAWSAAAVALWIPLLKGSLYLPTALDPIQWHTHELIFGYVPAVIAGFLLTAVPNWTGRLPVAGAPLLALFLVWAFGRLAVLCSAWIGLRLAGCIDLSFLIVLASIIARELVVGGNIRNAGVLALVGLLLIANMLSYAEVFFSFGRGLGNRLGIAVILVLIMLIGGRIIPSFTRNWLTRRATGRTPAPFGRLDVATIVASSIALAVWVTVPEGQATALLGLIACALNTIRLYRWAGERTFAEPLVLILHVAYAFVPLGFFLLLLAIVWPEIVSPTGALHAWTVGAIGIMTLAVMTRASLGHTGRPLTASRPIQFIYVAAMIAVLARLVAAFGLLREPMLNLSASAWVLAFVGFVVVYAPLLIRPRS
jgi:uncharacterized protein involved in response to NO